MIHLYQSMAARGPLGPPPGLRHPQDPLRPGPDHPTPMEVLAGELGCFLIVAIDPPGPSVHPCQPDVQGAAEALQLHSQPFVCAEHEMWVGTEIQHESECMWALLAIL